MFGQSTLYPAATDALGRSFPPDTMLHEQQIIQHRKIQTGGIRKCYQVPFTQGMLRKEGLDVTVIGEQQGHVRGILKPENRGLAALARAHSGALEESNYLSCHRAREHPE